jgi:crotonobetainyl-CoA:carnitine CoA-transferase CaiB-like acyl-CoA transferase
LLLENVAVVAIAANLPGPLAASRLRALGASVVKIEPLRGDPLADAVPAWYEQIVAGMEIVQFDLHAPEAKALVAERLREADLLLTAMRPQSLANVELDWETLHRRYPRLCSVALIGEAPPDDDRPGHDLTYQARAGMIVPPALPRVLVGDMAAAERVVSVGLALLLQRERTGLAGFATVAITDVARDFAEPYRHGLTQNGGVLGGGLPVYNIYAARDGWVAVAALEPHFAQHLRDMLGIDRLDAEAIGAAFAARSAQEWEELAQHHDVPLAAIR